MSKNDYDAIWQDRDIRFDLDPRQLRLRPGEQLIERIDNVEDTKGNNGDKGVLRISNIRLVWHAASMPRINLSIGYNCINGATTRVANSKIRGQTESLYLMAKNATTRFEFIFTCVNPAQTKLFTTVITVHRAYETTKLYRELKMRGAIVDDGQLRILPLEQQCDRLDGVWNLSSDQGNLGVMIVSNVRVVWFASMNSLYNVSIPYLQMLSCKVRDSKFGPALVIETSSQSGEYVLGFRIDPIEKLQSLCKEMEHLRNGYLIKPIFGVQYVKERPGTPQPVGQTVEFEEDDIDIVSRTIRPDAFATYFADGGRKDKRGPVHCDELGVAIEQLKDGFTLADLWNINVD